MALLYDSTGGSHDYVLTLNSQGSFEYLTTNNISDGHDYVDVNSVDVLMFTNTAADITFTATIPPTPGNAQNTISFPGGSTIITASFTWGTPIRVYFTELGRVQVKLTRNSPLSYAAYISCTTGVGPRFKLYGTLGDDPVGPVKPTNPTPANASGPGIDFSDFTFSWDDGGTSDSFNVYIGDSALTLGLYANVETTSYTPAPASAARSYILAVQDVIYWRVDAIVDEDTATGDVWSFDPRPGKASNPSPEDDATGRGLNIPLSWDAGDYADTYDVYLDTGPANDLIAQAISETTTTAHVPLDHSTTYAWRVDSENQFGVTEGDVWSFTTYSYDPPLPTWTNLPGKSLGPLDGGTAGVDFYYTGENFMMAVRSLVVAAGDAIWYEVPDA